MDCGGVSEPSQTTKRFLNDTPGKKQPQIKLAYKT